MEKIINIEIGDSLFMIIMLILLLFVVHRAAKRSTKNKRVICTRCNGEGYWEMKGEEEICNRCKGTGELTSYKNNNTSRSNRGRYDSWE